jgi:ribosome biogenesis SPOUT family RNA methylase Rps3
MSKVIEEKKVSEWTPEEKNNIVSNYGCELLIENATLEQIKDFSLPNDTYQIHYKVNNNSDTHVDLCRGTRVKIFDLYYDKFGKGSIIKIDFGYGRVNPRMWGYKQPEKKKKR